MKRIVYALALLSVASMLLFAFTGLQLWAPLTHEGESAFRFVLLLVAHIAPVMMAIVLPGRNNK